MARDWELPSHPGPIPGWDRDGMGPNLCGMRAPGPMPSQDRDGMGQDLGGMGAPIPVPRPAYFLLSWFNSVFFFHLLWYHFEADQDSASSRADEKDLKISVCNFSLFNLNWNSHQSTSQVFSISESTKTERADSASIIILWFFLSFQKKTLFFSNLLTHLFLIFHESLSAWHSKSWHALMSFCSVCRNSWERESLTSFFCAEKSSALSCLTAVESQWSFKS